MIVAGLLLIAGGLALTSGCVSRETTTRTDTFFDASGKVEKITETKVEKKDNAWVLRKKGFSMHSNAFLGEITSAVDPNSGMVMPTVKLATGESDVTDIPMINWSDNITVDSACNFEVTLSAEKSLWGAELAMFYFDQKSSGANPPQNPVSLNVSTALGSMAGSAVVAPAQTRNWFQRIVAAVMCL